MMMTGVSGHFSAAHRPVGGGAVHGHTWLVTVWVEYIGDDAEMLRTDLDRALAALDHSELPERLSRGELLAQYIAAQFAGALRVDVARPAERIFACWVAEGSAA